MGVHRKTGTVVNITQTRNTAGFSHGHLLRVSRQRETAIYRHDGMAWIADFKDGPGEVSDQYKSRGKLVGRHALCGSSR
jgi:hypothetical protein